MTQNDLFEYLDRLCSGIEKKSERDDARAELYDHVMNHYEKNIACGMDEDEARIDAVNTLGNADEIHNQFKAVHKKRRVSEITILLIMNMVLLVVFSPFIILLLFATGSTLSKAITVDDPTMYKEMSENFVVNSNYEIANTITTRTKDIQISVFPEASTDVNSIYEFKDTKYKYHDGTCEGEICYLSVDYSEEEYKREKDRLNNYYQTDSYKTLYGVSGPKKGYSLLTAYADCDMLIYAMSDNNNTGRIIYVYIEPGRYDLPKRYIKDIKDEYILEGFSTNSERHYLGLSLRAAPPELCILEFDIPTLCYVDPCSYTWSHIELPYTSWSDNIIADDTEKEIQTVDLIRDENTQNKYDLVDKTKIDFGTDLWPDKISCKLTNEENGEIINKNLTKNNYLPEGKWICEIKAEWDRELYHGTAVYLFEFVNK